MRNLYFMAFLWVGIFRLQAANPESRFYLDTLPTIVCPNDTVLPAFSGSCTAVLNYTVIADDDLLSYTVTQLTGLPSGGGFSIGTTVNTYLVTDLGGNTASCSFSVTVKDYDPPFALCKSSLTMILGSDDPDDCYENNGSTQFGSVKWAKAVLFNNGSYDACSNILISVRRMAPYSTFVQSLNQTNGHPPCDDVFPDFPSEYERAISESDSIKFYCAEANTTQNVALRVYQVDPSGNVSIGPDGLPILNECIVKVTVKDNKPPTCTPPAPVTVTCENFDPSLQSYGSPQLSDNCCISSQQYAVNYGLFDTICTKGTITRKWTIFDCTGASGQCNQRIYVNYLQNYFIRFPDDTLVSVCNPGNLFGKPVVFGEKCELIGMSYEDEVSGIPPANACFKIERSWSVINWCRYNPNLALIDVPNPNPAQSQSDPANKRGPIVSACGTAPPWTSTLAKITPADTVATDFCTFWDANANGYRYKQTILIHDTQAPVFSDCTGTELVYTDTTQNNPDYWNNVFNPNQPPQNLKEMPVDLQSSANDFCAGANVDISYQLWLDLDGNNTQETVILSDALPPADTVYYNNAQNPNYQGGTPVSFDKRAVPQNQKWRFALQQSFQQGYHRAALRWHNVQSPDVYVIPELPLGKHKIRWIATDPCGNTATCEYALTLKAGALSCVPPANVNTSCEAFDPSLSTYGTPSFQDACPPVSVNASSSYAQFDTLCSRGTITRSFNALDACGNTAQCSQKIVVNYLQNYYIKFPDDVIVTHCDNLGNYGEPLFFGEDCELLGVSYEDMPYDGVPDACFKLERTWTVINWCTYNPALPVIDIPNPNPNPIVNHSSNLPGPTVSACNTPVPWAPTIVKISPTDPNPTNYCDFWNAAANGYRYKQIIKIIDTEPPVFENCTEDLGHLTDPTANDNQLWNNVFDPNKPAVDLAEMPLSLSMNATDACSGSNLGFQYLLFLDLDHNSQEETVVYSGNLGASGLGWNKVLYNNINTPNYSGGTPVAFDQRTVPAAQRYGFAAQRQVNGDQMSLSVAWNTELAPNTFLAPQLPNGTHRIKWLLQDACGNNASCEQTFSIGDTTLVGTHEPLKDGFALLQNEPNPFSDNTLIRFLLPESMPADLIVYDISGRELYRRSGHFSRGWNALMLEKNLLGDAGICYYRLEAGRFSAWRKMVLTR